MRVDFVITEMYVSGAERCLTQLAKGLAESGDSVRVFSFANFPTGDQSLLVDQLRDAGIPVASAHADHVSSFLSASAKLRSWLVESPPDICQTFLFHANVLGTLAAKKAGVKIRVGGARIAEKRWFRNRIERHAVKQMSSLICVSHGVQEFAATHLNCPTTKSLVIPNGVDVLRFSTATPMAWSEIGWPDDSKVSLFVGRLHPQKGIQLLQSQIDSLAPAQSDRRLLIVGSGPLQSELKSWANDIGPDRVKMIPWQKEIAPIIKACRLLVLPSYYEGMPNVVLEAMAAAKPVVCSSVQGSLELLSHDRDRQVFPIGDDAAMRKLVEPFLADELICDDVGRRNQERVKLDFSVPAMVDAYRSFYRRLVV
ncbi:glycosyltransferase family 4 protein [Planctomycetes bacterium K23_9]|uniref:Teichuronic acid biosynthesis glycosyltransferase TuaC n=1 Tax=Stieleria marina TaxID=1930275 RepID=A0A517NR08_9BACT|nr:Putative teichuronic acid biosynthesis glycosyltransferase TuaC [Planctomycetes bacterium K23_9]